MCTRIGRLWQPGNPQTRVYLSDFWVHFIQSPSCGRNQLPMNAARFEVDPRMSRFDVRQHLEKIYGLPVRDVRVKNVMGKITYDNPASVRYRRALWKEPDRKIATVFVKKGFPINVQIKWTTQDGSEEQADKQIQMSKEQSQSKEQNDKFVNQGRPTIGRMLG